MTSPSDEFDWGSLEYDGVYRDDDADWEESDNDFFCEDDFDSGVDELDPDDYD